MVALLFVIGLIIGVIALIIAFPLPMIALAVFLILLNQIKIRN